MMFANKSLVGTALFLASEAVFFVFLIIAYVYFRGAPAQASASAAALDPRRSGLYTIALIASSVTIWRSGALVKQRRRATGWVLATAALGTIFLVGQMREYARLLSAHVTISRNVFGTTFFTLTGFHGLHVLIGVLLLMIVWIVARVDERMPRAFDAVSLYWHFVDVVWIVIFAIVYLPRFG
jgi:heme/copper-type cytochrome/quinol oxidase subunit 3